MFANHELNGVLHEIQTSRRLSAIPLDAFLRVA
jgi:hypothetical protein